MKHSLLLLAMASTICLGATGDDSWRPPDSLVLKGGKTVRGLIIKNTAKEVILQERFNEHTYPKSEIVRILDNADNTTIFTETARRGDLPAWRVMVNDLRTNDAIKRFVEIPAVKIDEGEFRNIPYKSFRANNDVEFNIYGDPEDPAGFEIGIYGPLSSRDKLRKIIRAYLAGFLTTRKEVAALYAIPFPGGLRTVGDMTIEITPKDAPDAFGAWWISLYNRKDLEALRMSDSEYTKLTLPVEEVLGRRGRVKNAEWTPQQLDMNKRIGSGDSAVICGFYRDKDGHFRLLSSAK